jgi:hypothetical protein
VFFAAQHESHILLRQRLMTMIARTDRDIYRSRRRLLRDLHIALTGTITAIFNVVELSY